MFGEFHFSSGLNGPNFDLTLSILVATSVAFVLPSLNRRAKHSWGGGAEVTGEILRKNICQPVSNQVRNTERSILTVVVAQVGLGSDERWRRRDIGKRMSRGVQLFCVPS